MTTQELIISIIIGIGTGLISGFVSGYFVSEHYRKKDEKLQWSRKLSEEKQNMSSYMILLIWEIDQLISGNGRDTKELERLLISAPKFSSFTNLKRIKLEHQGYTKNAYNLFNEINDYIKYDVPNEKFDLPKIKYVQYRSKLLRCQFDILTINTDQIQVEEYKQMQG